jgi:DNA-binding MarR family transcriptional regulator
MANELTDRGRIVAELIDTYEQLMHRLAGAHAPVFAEVDLTMAQAKALYIVVALERPRMSDVAARLGVALPTASGVVDRLVDLDLVTRHADAADRRHVIIAATARATEVLERFRELGVAQLRDLLALVTDDELEVVRRAIGILDRAARASDPHDPIPHPVDQHMPGSPS